MRRLGIARPHGRPHPANSVAPSVTTTSQNTLSRIGIRAALSEDSPSTISASSRRTGAQASGRAVREARAAPIDLSAAMARFSSMVARTQESRLPQRLLGGRVNLGAAGAGAAGRAVRVLRARLDAPGEIGTAQGRGKGARMRRWGRWRRSRWPGQANSNVLPRSALLCRSALGCQFTAPCEEPAKWEALCAHSCYQRTGRI